jgi:hypothetical protein
MKKILLKSLSLSIPAFIVVLLALHIPPGKTLQKRSIYAQLDKDSLLKNVPSPRIIFIGGSNLSFGLDSKKIQDLLGLNPINTSIHISLGLKYMLTNASQYIKENDIIVVSPEYEHFYGTFANGKIELLATVTDVSPESIHLLDLKQYVSLAPYIPKYIQSKLSGYLFPLPPDTTIGIYDRKAYNTFGDVTVHWKLPKMKVWPIEKIDGNLSTDILSELDNFRNIVTQKKAKLYFAFPCIQDLTFINCRDNIKEVENKLKESGYNILSTPERYAFPDSLMYNSPYHLTKSGVDIRTNLMIEDLKKAF